MPPTIQVRAKLAFVWLIGVSLPLRVSAHELAAIAPEQFRLKAGAEAICENERRHSIFCWAKRVASDRCFATSVFEARRV